ncbi:MAG TPA: NUDIX domain-containing protein [Chloroflexota bacterium]|nr:NUDIX domain-containing protein [Chloroflexota bacterium]
MNALDEVTLTPTALLAVDVVVFTLRPAPVEQSWQVLLVRQSDAGHPPQPRMRHAVELRDVASAGSEGVRYALPGVLVEADETFDGAARRALAVKAGLDARDWYLEQLATFGSPTRDTRARVASVAHIALVRSDDLAFSSSAAADAVEWHPVGEIPWDALAFDHAAMLREAIQRVRGKVRYAWVLFQLLPPVFTISELRAAYAAIRDPDVMHLSTSNMRKLFGRLIERGMLVPVGERAQAKGRGRPGDLFRFSGPLTGTWARELPW